MPFGMVAFSPEATPLPGRSFPITAPGGYEWRANGIRGFALTHLSGTGCTGASGDVPIMPVTVPVERSPSSVAAGLGYRSEEHTSELQSLMRTSNAVFCLKNNNNDTKQTTPE